MDAHGLYNSYKYNWDYLDFIASYYSMLPPCGKYDLTDHSHAMIIACNLLRLNEIPSKSSEYSSPSSWTSHPMQPVWSFLYVSVGPCWTLQHTKIPHLSHHISRSWMPVNCRHTDGEANPRPPANHGAWTQCNGNPGIVVMLALYCTLVMRYDTICIHIYI